MSGQSSVQCSLGNVVPSKLFPGKHLVAGWAGDKRRRYGKLATPGRPGFPLQHSRGFRTSWHAPWVCPVLVFAPPGRSQGSLRAGLCLGSSLLTSTLSLYFFKKEFPFPYSFLASHRLSDLELMEVSCLSLLSARKTSATHQLCSFFTLSVLSLFLEKY